MADAEAARKLLGVALVGFGDGGGIGGDGDGVVAQRLARGPGEVGRIGAARVGDDDAAHLAQEFEKPVLLSRSSTGSRALVSREIRDAILNYSRPYSGSFSCSLLL